MTEPLFFDTDCLSAFLWVDEESILVKLYAGRIVIPSHVYNELSYPGLNYVKGLKAQVDTLVRSSQVSVESIIVNTEAHSLFQKFTQNPDPNHRIIGTGEASAISMAIVNGGILASNNLKDISDYVQEYGLTHVTTGAIMREAMNARLIDEAQGNTIWLNMLSRKRRLGYFSFSDYLKYNH